MRHDRGDSLRHAPSVQRPAGARGASFRRPLRATLAAAGGLVALVASREAAAQQSGWALDRFDPAPAGDLFFQSQFPSYRAAGGVDARAALLGVYTFRPLVATVVSPAGTETLVAVEHSFVAHAQLNFHIAQRFGVDLSVPVSLVQSGSSDPVLPVRATSGVAVGDPRIGVRVRLTGRAEVDPFSLHLGAAGYLGFLGLSERGQNTTDGHFRARVFVTGAGRAGALRWSLTLGYHARSGFDSTYVTIGSELYANAGLGALVANDMLFVGAEGWLATNASAIFGSEGTSAEVLGVARVLLLNDALQVGLGAGPGLTQSVGTPAFRAMLGITWSPDARSRARSDEMTSGANPAGISANNGTGRGAGGVGAHSTAVAPHTEVIPRGAEADPRFCDGGESPECSTGDRDGDHVFEPLDLCPDTPAGAHPDPERVGCPDGDRDNDTVPDHADLCPTEARGAVPDPARLGCPLADRDGDHIADAVDHCPDRPGAPHPDPARNGCPGLVQIDQGILRILQPIFFAQGRDTIQARSVPVLEGVLHALQARTEILRMVIEGHTDDQGNDELNVDLSQRRAAAVLRWLIEHGIAPRRLDAHGFGPTRPRSPIRPGMPRRALRDARAANRRVEFEIVTDGDTVTVPPPPRAPSLVR